MNQFQELAGRGIHVSHLQCWLRRSLCELLRCALLFSVGDAYDRAILHGSLHSAVADPKGPY